MLQNTKISYYVGDYNREYITKEVEVIKIREVPVYNIYRLKDKDLDIYTIDGRSYHLSAEDNFNFSITYSGNFVDYKEPSIEELLKDIIPVLDSLGGCSTWNIKEYLKKVQK